MTRPPHRCPERIAGGARCSWLERHAGTSHHWDARITPPAAVESERCKVLDARDLAGTPDSAAGPCVLTANHAGDYHETEQEFRRTHEPIPRSVVAGPGVTVGPVTVWPLEPAGVRLEVDAGLDPAVELDPEDVDKLIATLLRAVVAEPASKVYLSIRRPLAAEPITVELVREVPE